MTTSCSVLGERLGEDLAASAPTARRFLLLEQPGPWRGRDAVTNSDLDAGLARELLAAADEAGVKVHLIRRTSTRTELEPPRLLPGRHPARPAVGRASRAARPGRGARLDLAEREPRAPWEQPVYAVCTHGKRDPCCARRGRPLARALRAARPEETWEIGHIGGHRFAATFLAFPHGLAFGRVPAAAGPEIVAGLERGELALGHLRGRAGDPPAIQAADVLVRRRLDLRGLDDVVVEGADDDSVTLRTPSGTLRATIVAREQQPRPISCGAEPEPVTEYELADLAPAAWAA